MVHGFLCKKVNLDLHAQIEEKRNAMQPFSNPVQSDSFKKGNVHVVSNYRQVSLTSVACKLPEHVICSHIHAHIEQHDLLTQSSTGSGKPIHVKHNY